MIFKDFSLPTIGHHHLQANGKTEGSSFSFSSHSSSLFSLLLFFPAFILFLFLFLDFPSLFSSLPVLIVASNNYGSFAKEQGDTCGHLCHGPHFVGVGRKQRLHPVELLIILPVVLRIFFFFITSHNDLFGNSRTKPYCLWFSEPSVAYKSCRLCK